MPFPSIVTHTTQEVLALPESVLLDYILNIAKENSPTFGNFKLRIGHQLNAASDYVWNGKLAARPSTPTNVIPLDFKIDHIEEPKEQVHAQAIKIMLADLNNFKLEHDGWIYPFQAMIPHKDWLQKYKVGDLVMAADTELQYSPLTLTQEIIDKHSYVIVRVAFGSDGTLTQQRQGWVL